MEKEKSWIPVYSFQQPNMIGVPKDTKPHPKKQDLDKIVDQQPKDPVCTAGVNVPVSTNQRLMKSSKKTALPPPKNAVTTTTRTFRWEADLRNKNKVLNTVKFDLNVKLARMQKDMKDMKEKCDSLEKENQKLKKYQESCILFLESRNCDPVTGEDIWKEEEENKKIQAEIAVLSEHLNADLELFSQMAKKQVENIQSMQTKWKQVEEEQDHFLEQQQSVQKEMEDLFAILDQEDNLLNSS